MDTAWRNPREEGLVMGKRFPIHPKLPEVRPHWFRAVRLRNSVPLTQVAEFIGLAYTTTSSLLNGYLKCSPETEAKLRRLAEILEWE